MNESKNAIEQFENMGNIVPRPEWKEKVLDEIYSGRLTRKTHSYSTVLIGFLGLLLFVNVLSFLYKQAEHKRASYRNELRVVARDLLVTTSSSKY